jgi:TatD DNase family protein
MSRKEPALVAETRLALEQGLLSRCIDVGTTLGDLPDRLQAMRDCGVRHCSLGLYPSHSADQDLAHSLSKLQEDASLLLGQTESKLVAIGEIGIDLHWNYADIGRQSELFVEQIKLANRLGLPVIIHNRLADKAIFHALKLCPPLRGGLLHCFSSDYRFAIDMVELGMLVSFAGNLGYKSSQTIQDAAKRLPISCLACETDSPYLSPLPFRGKPNLPSRVRLVYEFLAELRGVPIEELCLQIDANLSSVIPW